MACGAFAPTACCAATLEEVNSYKKPLLPASAVLAPPRQSAHQTAVRQTTAVMPDDARPRTNRIRRVQQFMAACATGAFNSFAFLLFLVPPLLAYYMWRHPVLFVPPTVAYVVFRYFVGDRAAAAERNDIMSKVVSMQQLQMRPAQGLANVLSTANNCRPCSAHLCTPRTFV